MQVIPSTLADFNTIFEFYNMAIAHQKKVFHHHWQGFSGDLITQEIDEKRQFKILVDGQIACIFAVTFSDPQIWEERNVDSAIYIHRIVTHADFRGFGFVNVIIDWAKAYSKTNDIQFIRMDTWADNEKLLTYYTGCGFKHVGMIKIAPNSGLPKHYEGISLNLFEIALD
ncbi:GNAT family N-acetyltransferase [Pedobacter boryungensis]|uniref:GNAT family N-acetyltransferase n=1 Tax=Pedobacter boryungensis TaxID=869962 RepID=A0ABX2DFS1_9SPHI|nr:GNAT family N-acetyltransferase [Pedobacter boryungensis]